MLEQPNKNLYLPSGLNSHFNYTGNSFTEYINHTRDIIKRARLDLDNLDPLQNEKIIDINSPFELRPSQSNSDNLNNKKYKRGIILIHGLFDSPCSIKSLAMHFREQNYLVRAILLPGHGTIPGDLLHVKYHEWVKATQAAVNWTQSEVDELYLCGFSTGAALALYHVLHHPLHNIKGLILLAPAIRLLRQFAVISNINNVLRKTIGGNEWFIKNENHDYAKYQSFTFNSAHQVYLLTQINQKILHKKSLDLPCFVAATTNDEVLNTKATINFFKSTLPNNNRCIIYSRDKIIRDDDRVEVRTSVYPEKNILSFSHIALPIAPNHCHYGEHGDFQDFLHYNYPIGKRFKHRLLNHSQHKLYFAAIEQNMLAKYHLQRLTYNPDFEYMINAIDKFIESIRVC